MALMPRLPLLVAVGIVGVFLSSFHPMATAAGLDARGKSTLTEATRLYKQGKYQEAARLLTDLSIDHPDVVSLKRNLGACYYYLRRPEPALSNLRDYLMHKDDITPGDKSEVERWIDEMERLRAQNAHPSTSPTPAALVHPVAPPSPFPPQAGVAPGTPAAAGSAASSSAQPVQTQTWQPAPTAAPAASGWQPPPTNVFLPPHPGEARNAQPVPGEVAVQSSHGAVSPVTNGSVISEGRQPSSEAGDGRGLRIAGIACGALGLASIGTGIYFYTRASSLSDKLSNADSASASDYKLGKDAETLQWVFYGVGAGAVATGLILYLLGSSQASSSVGVGVAPMIGPQTAGLTAQGAF